MSMSYIRRHWQAWAEWLLAGHREKVLKDAERQRQAIIRAKQRRREKHQAFRFLDGDLRQATNESLAASCGREWRAQ